MPRLTVIMPVKNGERTIGRAVSSTLRALPRDSELVVFDDASTDATTTLLRGIDDRRLVVLSSTEASGVTGGLNHLLDNTDSELVGRMDADDIALPWRFRRQQRMIGPRCQVCFTTVLEWYSASRRISPNPPVWISADAFPFHLLLTNPVAHPTMLATRSVLESVGGYRDVPSEDYDLWIRLQLAGARLRCGSLPGLLYRMHDAQITASAQWRRSSWANPEISAAFQELSLRLLGHPFLRLTTLSVLPRLSGTEFEQTLVSFEKAITNASHVLRSVERSLLLRKLRSRLAAARSSFRASRD